MLTRRIKPGCTYLGRNGAIRTVTMLAEGVVYYVQTKHVKGYHLELKGRHCTLSHFALWAKERIVIEEERARHRDRARESARRIRGLPSSGFHNCMGVNCDAQVPLTDKYCEPCRKEAKREAQRAYQRKWRAENMKTGAVHIGFTRSGPTMDDDQRDRMDAEKRKSDAAASETIKSRFESMPDETRAAILRRQFPGMF